MTDCTLTRSSQLEAHRLLSKALRDELLIDEQGKQSSKTFHQLKYHAHADEAETIWPDGQCMLQTYNVFWDTTGHKNNGSSYCYPCDSVTVLTNEQKDGEIEQDSEREFNPNIWGTVRNTEVEILYKERVRPYFDPREHCKGCLFALNNKKVGELSSMDNAQRETMALELTGEEQPLHIEFP